MNEIKCFVTEGTECHWNATGTGEGHKMSDVRSLKWLKEDKENRTRDNEESN